jgi:ferredoxin-nitrate reductase
MVTNARGTVRVCAKVSDTIRKGVVFLPMHWGRDGDGDDARANNLTPMLLDPSSKQPDFKYAAVQVTRYEKPPEKIVVAGAGAATHRFLCSYRSLNRKDEIVVISREKHSFYNRVLLPEYTNDTVPWERLQKLKAKELEELDIHLEEENELMAIDREGRFAVDKHGAKHFYDKLILATGSRAHIPNDAPQDSVRVLTLRTRQDADRLKKFLVPGAHILIVGGGLLGLELAVALREVDVAVSILQLGSRLMERQLDDVAAELLLDYVDEKNITVYMNDQLLHAKSEETVMILQLRSGKTIRADAIVYAVGTRPNIEFALEAGIECARGVIVDDHLQTSDPHIFAIGEIAEHNGRTLGITSAAEKQADVLARFIHGDMQSTYDGAVSMNILKLPGFDLCSLGIPEAPTNEAGYDEILFVDRSMRYYKKCIINDDRLVGAILVGDKSEFAEFKMLIENKTELSERRLQLLRSGRKVNPPAGKLVCSCNQVGTEDLRRLVLAGHGELKALCEISGAGLGCGSCKPEIQHILRETALKKETIFS